MAEDSTKDGVILVADYLLWPLKGATERRRNPLNKELVSKSSCFVALVKLLHNLTFFYFNWPKRQCRGA